MYNLKQINMKDLISKAAITANTKGEVYEQVINELESRGFMTASNTDEAYSYFSGNFENVSLDDFCTRNVQSIELDGVPQEYNNCTYIPTITVDIAENYVDSGSCDYVYTVSVKEE